MIDFLPITKNQLRIFIFSFLIVFIMICLQYLGITLKFGNGGLLFPIPQETSAQNSEAMQKVSEKLAATSNTFSLYPKTQFFSNSYETALNHAGGYMVVDLDSGAILSEFNAQQQMPIASLTKIMTAIVAIDLTDPTDIFSVSEHAASIEPTEIGVLPGEKLTLDELLQGLLLVSANDAAEIIKEGIDQKYGEAVFIKAMNEKARLLGLHNTNFANPQGFDDPHNYSSAADLAILTKYAMTNYPLINSLAIEQSATLPENSNHKAYSFVNWNGLLGVYPDALGLKIGNTDDAGKTTVVTSKRGGKTIAAIVLGAPNIVKRDLWAADLLDLGYKKTLNLPPVKISEAQLLVKYNTWVY